MEDEFEADLLGFKDEVEAEERFNPFNFSGSKGSAPSPELQIGKMLKPTKIKLVVWMRLLSKRPGRKSLMSKKSEEASSEESLSEKKTKSSSHEDGREQLDFRHTTNSPTTPISHFAGHVSGRCYHSQRAAFYYKGCK